MGLMLSLLCGTSPAPTFNSNFRANNTDSTMIFYSYLRESSLEETGYKQGYKAGSLSYLVDGNIYFIDSQRHYDGQKDYAHKEPGDDLNATFTDDQNIIFDGRKGISEFYAQGFFPSNRAVSAGNKIRYDDLTGYILGPSAMSPKIRVNASVGMGPATRTGKVHNDYDFRYNARVWDGRIDARDETGWTNKTGSRSVDWEQDVSLRGKILDISNNLSAESLFYPGGIGKDWLPCWICAGQTQLETYKGWPSEETKNAVLTPPEVLPNLLRESNCSPITGCAIRSKASLPLGTIGFEAASLAQSNQLIPARDNIHNPCVTKVTRDINKPISIGLMSRGG